MRAVKRELDNGGFRSNAGLPVTVCPNCDLEEPHWVPESLNGPGRFTCDGRPDARSDGEALDLEWGDLS